MKYFTSDFHCFHEKLLSFRPFITTDEMNEKLCESLSVLKRGDILYYLGDIAMKRVGFDLFFSSIPKGVDVHWILGNHDEKYSKKYSNIVASVQRIKYIKIGNNKTTLCHFPMYTWNCSHYNAWHLFGHHHNDKIKYVTGKSLNVNIELHEYKLWSEEEVIEFMNTRPDNWDLVERRKDK